MPMDNVTLENTQQSISSRDAKSVASVMVNGKWVNLSDTLEQANVKSDVGTVSKQVAEQQTMITSAVAQADSAVAYANDAIEKSRVNSQAIVEINSAVSDAVSDAAVARSDGLRAWNAAQSNVDLIDSNYASASAAISSARTEAIAAADEAKASASAAGQDITTLKSQAGQFEQEMADAKGDISTLQATATGFKNTLTDAQGNISTLQSDVAGLKKTTSDHAGNIATLQADAKTLTSQMADAQGNISTLQQTASGFSSKVSGMETSLADANSKINDITSNGGGRNLLIGTGTASGDVAGGDGILVKGAFNGYDAVKTNTPWHERMINLKSALGRTNAKAGDWHTISVYVKADKQINDGFLGVYRALGSVDADTNDGFLNEISMQDKPITTQWQQYAWSFQINDISLQRQNTRVEYNQDTGDNWIYWAGWMLEKGTVAHDWQPAPEDTDAKITTNSAAIDQNKKAIALKADQTTVDKANGDVQLLQSQLKVQSDQIKSKVSSLDLPNLVGKGGRNLVANTGTDFVIDATSNSNGYTFVAFSFIEQPKQGDLITVSAEGTLTGTGALGEYQVVLYNATTTNQRSQAQYLKAGKRDSVTLSLDNLDGDGDTVLLIYAGKAGETQGRKNVVHHLMVETGAIAHGWQPAPEDAQTYTQTQIKQTADAWNANLTSVKNDLTDKYTNLHATVDGIQAQVYNSDGSSRITQLSNLIATKVSSGDYNSQITQLKNDINLRVQKGNVVSQINQEAGGNTLIQVANGQGKLALNASSVIFSGSAFIPDAYITTLNADKLRFYDSSGNVATMSAGLEQYDDDKANKTIVLEYAGGYEVHASNLLGSILTMHDNTIRLAVKANGMASSGNVDQYSGVYVMQHYAQLSNYRSNGSAPGIYITDDGYTIKGDSTGSGTKWGDLNITSPQIYVTGGNSVSLSGGNAVQMQVNKTHAWLSAGMLHLYNDNDSSSTATELRVEGWAWINGWVEAAGHSQHSALSTKTEIQPVDDDKMLEMVNDTDLATFLYKTDVANGETHRHIGLIIDDVHDVAQYQTPQEFIAPNGVSRDDDNMIGALFGAVKALTKRIKTLESKVG